MVPFGQRGLQSTENRALVRRHTKKLERVGVYRVSCALQSKRGRQIMSSIGEIQPAGADRRSEKFDLIGPAALAIGGALSLVWAGALGLGTYHLVCWLFA